MIREALAAVSIASWDALSGRHVLKKKRILAEDTKQTVEENRRLQRKRLADILNHAVETVPYYQRFWSGKTAITEDNAQDVLKSFPILTKNLLRDHFDEFISTKRKPDARMVTTGGSTGVPTTILKDPDHVDWLVAAEVLFYEWAGYTPGLKIVKVWGSERDVFESTIGFKNKVQNFLMNRDFINTFRLKPSQLPLIVEQFKKYQEKRYLIYGYVESIYLLTKYLMEHDIEIPRPVAILTSAGTLYPEIRKLVIQKFGCPVLNKYGSREINSIACDCPEMNGLHEVPRLNYMEILDNQGQDCKPGEIGEIIITSLTNRSMPLIRYQIGDMAMVAHHECGCGMGFPVINNVVGRTSDIFKTAQGELVHGEFFTHIFYEFPWIERFRIIQQQVDEFDVEIEDPNHAAEEEKQDVERRVKSQIRTVFGEDTKVNFIYKTELQVPDSGKFRFTISKLQENESNAK